MKINLVKFDNFKPLHSTFYRKNNFRHYAKDFICFDCETSHNHDLENPICWVYQWCFSYQNQIIYGRHIKDFIDCLIKIKDLCTNEKQKHIVFIHNLSFDLQYMKDFLIEKFGTDYEMIALENHKFITFSISNFEFRCTYRLSNRSLDKWSRDLNTQHKKLVGTVDYDIVRTTDTPLTKNDWRYQIYDVIVLKECVEKEMQLENDNICTLPLTSTGFVRRDIKKSFKANFSKNRKLFYELKLNREQYLTCKRAFMGGYTHANRFIVDKNIKGNIRHFDFDSHYPTQQITKKFPMSRFLKVGENLSFEDIEKYNNEDYCYICNVFFSDIELKDKKITFPYLSTDKVKKGKISKLDIYDDNGRIKKCNGQFIISLTNIDLEIIRQQYNFSQYDILDCFVANADYLPNYFTDVIKKYYFQKTDLKEKLKVNYNEENALNLMKAKNKLNGIYGMSATDIVRQEIKMLPNGEWEKTELTNDFIVAKLLKYYKSKNSVQNFQWGLFTTAYARQELIFILSNIIGYENVLYCDTDSAFFITNNDIENRIKKYNEECYKQSLKNDWYIETDKGKKYFHNFTDENENITNFKTLHSKCYGYITDDNNLHCTIAGVQAYAKNTTREKELGTLDELKQGKVFYKCGGTRSIYVEKNDITNSGIIIENVTKTLSTNIDFIYDIYMED